MKKMIIILAAIIVLCSGCTSSNSRNEQHSSIVGNTITEEADELHSNSADSLIKEALTQPITDHDQAKRIINDVLKNYRNSKALPYNEWGIYNLDGKKKVYTFDPPNDFYQVVMMDSETDNQAFIIHYTGKNGIAFGQWGYYYYKDYPFYGLTSQHVLFKKDNIIMAVPISPLRDCQGKVYWNYMTFDELPIEEQQTAVYPNPEPQQYTF